MTGAVRRSGEEGVLLEIRVTPRSSRDAIAGRHTAVDGTVSLAVKVSASPDKGKANQAVIDLMSEAIGVPRSCISIRSGKASRSKLILIRSPAAAERVERLLAEVPEKSDKNG